MTLIFPGVPLMCGSFGASGFCLSLMRVRNVLGRGFRELEVGTEPRGCTGGAGSVPGWLLWPPGQTLMKGEKRQLNVPFSPAHNEWHQHPQISSLMEFLSHKVLFSGGT